MRATELVITVIGQEYHARFDVPYVGSASDNGTTENGSFVGDCLSWPNLIGRETADNEDTTQSGCSMFSI